MGKLVKTIFGGTDDSAQEGQIEQNAAARQYIEQMAGQGRADLMNFAPGAEANRNMGYQSALDVYGQTIPQQLDTFQQGNVGAQNMLLAGMPQFQNAIMGAPVDYSMFQPQQIGYDAGYAQQQLPQFQTTADLLGGLNPGQPGQPGPGFGGYGQGAPMGPYKTRTQR